MSLKLENVLGLTLNMLSKVTNLLIISKKFFIIIFIII